MSRPAPLPVPKPTPLPVGVSGVRRPKTGGRKAGTPNRTHALLKDAVLRAAEISGNKIDPSNKEHSGLVKYLVHQSMLQPAPFMQILAKVLPMQIGGPGDDGEGIQIMVKFTEIEDAQEHPGTQNVRQLEAKRSVIVEGR